VSGFSRIRCKYLPVPAAALVEPRALYTSLTRCDVAIAKRLHAFSFRTVKVHRSISKYTGVTRAIPVLGNSINWYAVATPPSPRTPRRGPESCSHPAIRGCGPQHHSGGHPCIPAGRRGGEPPAGVCGRGHGQRLVRGMETGIGGHHLRPHGERLFL